MAAHLFAELRQRGVVLRNRIAVSPMCQYACEDGRASDGHLVHLGSRAVGGAGLVMAEAAAVLPQGRISPADLGVWRDDHVEPLARIFRFIRDQGAVPAIQLSHAGRKASTDAPWRGGRPVGADDGGWTDIVGPSAVPFEAGYPTPAAMDTAQIAAVVAAFVAAARRVDAAGAAVLEIHAAHGYLLHQFLSPLSNQRTDAHGGSFENRTRLLRETVTAIRDAWPDEKPLWLRISATDWVDGGWDLEQSVALVGDLGQLGVDLVDCSSGGIVPGVAIPVAPGYQVPLAERIRRETGVATGAVGLITEPEQADAIVRGGQADVVLMAREFLRSPYWPLRAAAALGRDPAPPPPYERGF